MTADLHTLSGAYALDALEPDERQQFERHLAACESCQQEVRELQATAATLAVGSSEEPPQGLKQAVMDEIDQTRQDRPIAPLADLAQHRARRGRVAVLSQRLVGAAAAVLAVAVVALGATVASLNDRLDQVEARSEQLQALVAAGDTQTLAMDGPDGARAHVLVSPSAGQAVVFGSGMAPAPDGKDYELWFVLEDAFVPAGLLTVDADGTVAHSVQGDLAGVVALAVTIEPAGGSAQPTTDPIMAVELAT
ncbi:MAG: anti-sigma factor [Nitriliruptorales bacterium]|nr:anti-sigma factor [Nitriliruptorales bacterium]